MKTFILGLGAQKCGTTWLHGYLAGLESVDLGFMKEYRVLDPLPPAARFGRSLRALGTAARATISGAAASPATRQAKFLLNRRLYYDYFAKLLDRPGIAVTGDISPAYSGLKAPALREVRENFERRGISVRPLFLMRDPVERCWSSVRMGRRNFVRPEKKKTITAQQMAMTEEEHLLSVYCTERFAMRTRYDLTVAQIDDAFEPELAIYAFFEQLFTEGTIKGICDTLGLSYRAPEFERPVNVSEKNSEISDSAKAEIARFYEPVYAFAAERFGKEQIRQIWPNYRFVA